MPEKPMKVGSAFSGIRSAASISGLNAQECESLGNAKSTRGASESLKSTGPESNDTAMCEPLPQMSLHPSMFSAPDSPANPSASPASDSRKKTNVGSGPSAPELLATFDPDTQSWKTCRVSLAEEWETYSETWPRWGMTRSGAVYGLPTPAQLISAREFGSSHIPEGDGLWPTPAASQFQLSEEPERWLARRTRVRETANNGNGMGMPLTIAARLWPTPRASDGNGPGRHGTGGLDLRTAVDESTPAGGQLNPEWVEWLMGFPAGWTDLKDSETPSSRKSQSGSDGK